MRALILAIVGLGIILMGSVGAIQVGYQEAVLGSQPEVNHSESFTPTHNTTHDFDASYQDGAVYAGGDDVDVSQNGVSVASNDGENWQWNRDDGTLYVPAESDLNESQQASINFSSAESEDVQQLNKDVGMTAPNIGSTALEIGGPVLFLASVVILARMGGK